MRWTWVGLALATSLGGCGSPSSPSGDGLLPIEEVLLHIAESYPVQVTAQVVGYLPDGCTSLGEITQTRAGNAISIAISAHRSGGPCVQVIEPVEKWIALRGPFPAGDYLLQVNDHTRRFHVD